MDIKIPCPQCHRQFSVSRQEIVPGASSPCPECGTQIKFSGADARKVQGIIEQLGNVPGIKVKVNVKERRRPWWKFWR
jgi:ssDNA-binding Zn-finger/Zn-ribbon topoisomerase 1